MTYHNAWTVTTVYPCCTHCTKKPHVRHMSPCLKGTCSGSVEIAQGLREGATSESDGAAGGELHAGNSMPLQSESVPNTNAHSEPVALTWLEIGAATREGIAKQ